MIIIDDAYMESLGKFFQNNTNIQSIDISREGFLDIRID